MFARMTLLTALVGLAAACYATALDVSVTIEGDIDDIIRLLEVIKRAEGPGGPLVPTPAESPRLRVHSMTVGSIEDVPREVPGSQPAPQTSPTYQRTPEVRPGPAPMPEPQSEPPAPRLSEASLRPSQAAPGQTLSARVRVIDPEAAVDMVEAAFAVPGGLTLDLFDNGSRGDEKPGDGIWTRTVPLPSQTPPGDYLVTFTAYDVNGTPVSVTAPDGSEGIVRTYSSVTVLPPPQSQTPTQR